MPIKIRSKSDSYRLKPRSLQTRLTRKQSKRNNQKGKPLYLEPHYKDRPSMSSLSERFVIWRMQLAFKFFTEKIAIK